MLTVSAGLIIWTHHRRAPSTPWLYYLPVVIIMLSLVQAGNTLWGFQMAWYLVMLSLAAALLFLDWPTVTEMSMAVMTAAAMIAAFVGSFSSLMGLFIWPVGLIVIWHRQRARWLVVGWIAAAALTTLFYFSGFNFGEAYSDTPYLIHHPVEGIKTFFFVIGNMFGAVTYDNTGIHPPGAPDLKFWSHCCDRSRGVHPQRWGRRCLRLSTRPDWRKPDRSLFGVFWVPLRAGYRNREDFASGARTDCRSIPIYHLRSVDLGWRLPHAAPPTAASYHD